MLNQIILRGSIFSHITKKQYIQSRDDWQFVRVYTDEGITGTSTKRCEGFKQMVADALDGQIDLIITKSVSRFARNTVDSWHGLVDYATVYSEYDIRFTFKNGQEIKA